MEWTAPNRVGNKFSKVGRKISNVGNKISKVGRKRLAHGLEHPASLPIRPI
jgi:hypothetical protein